MSLRSRLSLLGATAILVTACSGGGATQAPASAEPTQAPASSEATEAPPATVNPDSLLGKILAAGKIRISTDPNYAPFSSPASRSSGRLPAGT